MKTNGSLFFLCGPCRLAQNFMITKTRSRSMSRPLLCHAFYFLRHQKLSTYFLWLILGFSIMQLGEGFAQEKCDNALAEAQSFHTNGRFADAILKLESCMPDKIIPEQRIHAYRLLALCYLKEDYGEKARMAVRKIFDINRQYEPDPVQDEQKYRDLVAEVKATLPKPLRERLFGGVKKWLWLGGGGIASGFIIAALSPDGNPALPDLPVPPRP